MAELAQVAVLREVSTTEPFEAFFRREYPRLVPMLQALVGDRAAAEDVAQEALAAAQQQWARLSAYDKPGAWVRRVALNRAANVRRGRGREGAALRRMARADGVDAAAPMPDERLWASVRALPEHQRHAVVLHYVDDRPLSDIAVVMRCSVGTVKTHLSRARAALARQLAEPSREVPT